MTVFSGMNTASSVCRKFHETTIVKQSLAATRTALSEESAVRRSWKAAPSTPFAYAQVAQDFGARLGRHADASTYQDKRRENWNWRGSYEAVGAPASFQMGFTAATLFLLMTLNRSIVPCSCILSPNLKARAMRRSLKKT